MIWPFRLWPFNRSKQASHPDVEFVITRSYLADLVGQMLDAGWSSEQAIWVLGRLEAVAQMSMAPAPKCPKRTSRRADSPVDIGVDTKVDIEAERAKWREQKAIQRQRKRTMSTDKLKVLEGGRADNVRGVDRSGHEKSPARGSPPTGHLPLSP